MTTRFASTALVFLVALSLALPTLAQDDGGRRGQRGQRGGFGGPGGGFGGPGGPNRNSDMLMLGLLRVEEVREEIELMPDQEEAFKKLEAESREQRPDFARLRDASDQERREMMEKMREEMEERMKVTQQKMEEILLPEQLERLQQIAIQSMGIGALSDPKVIAALKVTDEQQKKMESIREESTDKIREMFSGVDREDLRGRMEEMREKMTEARENSEKQMLAVLTSDQLIKFDEMKGKPFDMPEDRGRGGFGRGGFGGPGGGGGPGGNRPRRGNRPPSDNN